MRFATREEAESAAEKLKTKIGENGLRLVDVYSLPSKAANSVPQDKWVILSLFTCFTIIFLTIRIIILLRVVLRDVPKEASLKDFVSQFPDANAVVIYKNTFPASKFWYGIDLLFYQQILIPRFVI